MIVITPKRYAEIRVLADKLIASCDGGHDQWEEVNELSRGDCKVLDTMALECQVCNQWFRANEMIDDGGQWECSDCHDPD